MRETPPDPSTDLPPPPPPFATSCELDPSTEVDVDLDEDDDQGDEDQQLRQPTIPEGVTYLGDAPDLATFFKGELEDLVDPSIAWVLDCLDIPKIRARYEIDGSRICLEKGHVYRLSDPDPPPPWMPTRSG